jgi:hypothetical protein
MHARVRARACGPVHACARLIAVSPGASLCVPWYPVGHAGPCLGTSLRTRPTYWRCPARTATPAPQRAAQHVARNALCASRHVARDVRRRAGTRGNHGIQGARRARGTKGYSLTYRVRVKVGEVSDRLAARQEPAGLPHASSRHAAPKSGARPRLRPPVPRVPECPVCSSGYSCRLFPPAHSYSLSRLFVPLIPLIRTPYPAYSYAIYRLFVP